MLTNIREILNGAVERLLVRLWFGLAAALLLLGASGAVAEDAEVLSLDIERQPAGSALMELAGSSGVQILVSDEPAAEVEVEGLQGQYRFADALAALLADTRLSYHYASENVVLVEARQDGELEEVETVNEAEAEFEEQEPPAELAAQRVTGSRMARGDPSARVYSLSAEDIAARGVSSLEELFRTLPWAYASLTSQSGIGGRAAIPDTDVNMGPLYVGMSAVNLRAMGSANTLVLVNGRRVAGTAGFEDDFVNLINVPLSAIERIDIQLDGASAVYGADAIGGVVNFITKRNYTGFSATFREEFSATDADRRNASLKGGYAWGTGSVTAIAQRDDSKPVNNRKIWTSGDFREQFGPEYDNRETLYTQPGTVCEWNGGSTRYGARCDRRAPKLSLPATHDGTGATEADFATTITPADYIPPQNGADATNTSVFLQIEQYVTDSLRIHADMQISDTESYQETPTQFLDYLVPASNAFNPFGRHVVVSYYPIHELENGLVSPAWMESENKQRNFNAGLFWQFGDSHEFELGVTRSKSERHARQLRPEWPPNRFAPGQKAFFAALASSDPNVAPNLFGNGTAQKSTFADLLAVAEGTGGPIRGFSEVTSWDALLRGEVLEVWGGPISYAIGAEFRETKIYSDSLQYAQDGSLERTSGREDRIGVEKPARDSNAWFAEFAIPLVGEGNAMPGLRELVLSLQARRDTHKSLGATGGRDLSFDPTPVTSTWWEYHPDDGWVERSRRSGQPVWSGVAQLREITRSATSPRVGLYYEPTGSLQVRIAWSRSFTPPVFSNLFSIRNDFRRSALFVDPYHPDGTRDRVRIPTVFSTYNPDIKNEHSDNYSLGFKWTSQAAPGWVWSVDWSRIDFTDKIEYSSGLLSSDPEIAFGLPDIVKRDEKGYAVEVITKQVNLAEKISETLDTTIEYTFSTSWGLFTPRLSYHRVLEEFYRITPDTDRQERVGTALGSDRYKLTGHLTWTAGRFTTDLYLRYTPGYTNSRTGNCRTVAGRCTRRNARRPPLEVDPLTTVDLTVAYRMDNGLRIRAGGRNILNADSPTMWKRLPYDPTRWDARARVLYLELNWEL